MKNKKLTIIAGPCSVNENNLNEIYEISNIKHNGQKSIAGTRVVGLKSRTALNNTGEGMGMDYHTVMKNCITLYNDGSISQLDVPPSVRYAEKIVNETGLLIATEIMMPLVQMPLYERRIPAGKLMPWNPSVDQLGWHLMQIAYYAKKNKWKVGIKNGKWLGAKSTVYANSGKGNDTEISVIKAWAGLTKYIDQIEDDICMIHRGFHVPEKNKYRSMPLHGVAKRAKKVTKENMYFDPSHSLGSNYRDQICEKVIEAMNMQIDENEYLYDGVLIEVGTSETDTDQHITVAELKDLVKELSKIRNLVSPE